MTMDKMRQRVQATRHGVIKIGSALFLNAEGRVDRPAFAALVEGIDGLLRRGWTVTVVSSGAVAMGRQRLGEDGPRPDKIAHLQALAALGQSRLIEMYEAEFAHYDRQVAQVLFSRGDLSERGRYLNARRTLQTLHKLEAVPVINENDTVATEELRFGDNDQLAAMTAGLIGADTLVLLSDVAGLKKVVEDDDGERRLGAVVDAIEVDDPRIDHWAGPSESGVGTGGMISKVRAARIAARAGVVTVIASGKKPGVLAAIADGRDEGTVFDPGREEGLGGRKLWLGGGAMARGQIVCDKGALAALTEQGASLLPSGITAIEGDFDDGEVVEIVDAEGQVRGRGVSVYDAEALRKIAGVHSSQIEEILGYCILDEAVHRDNLVIF